MTFEEWWERNGDELSGADADDPKFVARAAWEANNREHARRIAEAYAKGGKNALEEGAG